MQMDIGRMTHHKTEMLCNEGYVVTGYVIEKGERDLGEKIIVDRACVRHFTNEEFWKLMHPEPIDESSVH